MIQALHIFRKDVRRFAYEVCVLGVLAGGWEWAHIVHHAYAGVAAVILILGWWYLIAQLIHAEALTGDREFWITRPYSRASLLAAKALFVMAFINMPLLLGGFAILGAAGYRPLAYLPNFLWMQFTFTAVALLLPIALATLTRTLVQFVLTILGLLGGVMALGVIGGTAAPTVATYQSKALLWADIFPLSIGMAALCVLLLQFRQRSRLISAGFGIALMVVFMACDSDLQREIGTAVQSRMFGQRGAEAVTADLAAAGVERDAKAPDHTGVALAVPIRIRNIPDARTAAPEILELTFEAPGGRRWSSGWISAASSEATMFQADASPDRAFTWRQRVVIDRRFWESAHSRDVRVHGVVWAMLYERRDLRLGENRTTPVPGEGRCSTATLTRHAGWFVNCTAPFRMPFTWATGQTTLRLMSVWDSPLPADFGMNPLSTNMASGGSGEADFLRYDPRAYIQRSIGPATVQLK